MNLKQYKTLKQFFQYSMIMEAWLTKDDTQNDNGFIWIYLYFYSFKFLTPITEYEE